MKKFLLAFFTASIALFMFSCSDSKTNDAEQVAKVMTPTNPEPQLIKKDEVKPPTVWSIPVGESNFNKLTKFIEKNGFVVEKVNGKPADHQYTFFDKSGNRHALMTIRRDADNQPSASAPIKQISVWAYVDGIKDQEHFFGYIINQDVLYCDVVNVKQDPLYPEKIQSGYEEFLAMVSK